jgi:hypothetical protein
MKHGRDARAATIRNLKRTVGIAQSGAEHARFGMPFGIRHKLLRKNKYRPRAALAALLLARENPSFVALRMSAISGNCAAIISGAPSVDALSTTTTSSEAPCGWRNNESRQAQTSSRQFQLGMHTETSTSAGNIAD